MDRGTNLFLFVGFCHSLSPNAIDQRKYPVATTKVLAVVTDVDIVKDIREEVVVVATAAVMVDITVEEVVVGTVAVGIGVVVMEVVTAEDEDTVDVAEGVEVEEGAVEEVVDGQQRYDIPSPPIPI